MTLSEIVTLGLGGTNLVQFYLAWQSRKSNVKGTEADAMAKMQEVYDKFTAQTDIKFDKMQSIIDEQAQKIISLEKNCFNCVKNIKS